MVITCIFHFKAFPDSFHMSKVSIRNTFNVYVAVKILLFRSVVYPEGFRCRYTGLGAQTMCPNY